MTFLATQSDKLILGKLFSLEFLGIYTVAYTFADLPRQIMSQLNLKVIFPVIAKQINLPRAELKQKLQEKRNLLLLGLIGGLTLLICFGDWIILTLYDNRYSAGAWMLPILAAGLWLPMLAMTIDPVLYALGTPQYVAVGNGGTGNTALTLNGVVLGQGSSALTTVVSSTEGHVLQISSAGVPTFAHLNGGSF
jgi:O-antigen/teichoic acid export membrane protein